MGNAGSMDQHPDFRGHNMPLKLPMPDPGELEERFASVLVSTLKENRFHQFLSLFPPTSVLGHGQLCVCVGWTSVCLALRFFVAEK